MNRVKITYSIDLDEVPEKTQQLIDTANLWLQEVSKTVEQIDCKSDFESLTKSVDSVRIGLMKVDTCLEDCLSIMAGYHKALIELSSPQVQTEHSHPTGDMVVPEGFDPTQMFQKVAEQMEELKGYRQKHGGDEDESGE